MTTRIFSIGPHSLHTWISRTLSALAIGAGYLLFPTIALALPLKVDHADLPNCDTLIVPQDVHELGIAPAFSTLPDELIEAVDTLTSQAACPSDDPTILNALVVMTNTTGIAWKDVWYVADPGDQASGAVFTTLSNVDGVVDMAGGTNRGFAFKIDTAGINTPLIGESGLLDGIFSPGETWEFIIDDYFNAAGIGASVFDSLGVASASAFAPPSSGSIIAVAVPEPATCMLLVISLGAIATRRQRC
jgi:hypothetical protein